MSKSNIINLAEKRDALAELEKARAAILAGNVDGWGFYSVHNGLETLRLGGVLRHDSRGAMRAILRLSATQAREDDPPLFQASQMQW